MPAQSVEVINDVGLHATPLAQFVSKAREFADTQIRVRQGDRESDGKSLIGMLALEALKGATITITTDGPNADDALTALVGLVASGFQARR